jgi:hypothetical protein
VRVGARSTAEFSRSTSSLRRLAINLVRRTKRSACCHGRTLRPGDQRVVLDAIESLRLAGIRPNAYDVERRLGVEHLRGHLPEELRSASFPPASVKKRLIPSAAARRAGWGATVRHRVVRSPSSWC